jgi:VWFA-related protein
MRDAAGLLLFLLSAVPAPVVAQTIHSETRVVLVDAVVTDKKGHVQDLTARNFEIFEDGRKQTITSFSAPKGQTRYTILLFDDPGMDNAGKRQARESAIRFVDANGGPNQMVAIVNLRTGLQVAQNFTADPGRLKTVLAADESPPPGLTRAPSDRTSALLLAVQNLAQNSGSAPGRKTLIVFTADSELGDGTHSAEIGAALDACNRANIAIYGVDTRGIAAPPDGAAGHTSARPPMRSPIGGFDCLPGSQTDCRQDEMPAGSDSSRNQKTALLLLSNGSGGFLIAGTNDPAAGLGKIASDQNEYYQLGYTPPDSPEGSCHKLRVKVDRAGTTVRARTEYCNAQSNNVFSGNAGSLIDKELESLPVSPPGGSNASLEVPFFYSSGNLARVSLAMEIPLRKLGVEKKNGKLSGAIHVLGIAHRPDGSVAARFSESVGLAAFLAAPFHYVNQFEIAPGSYTFQVAWDAGDSRGKVETPLIVEAHASTEFALSGLILSGQYGPAADLRLGPEAGWTADRTPLIAEGLRIVPSGSNRFRKSDTPVVYAEIYEPSQLARVGIGIRILDRKTGEQKVDTGVLRIALPAANGNPAIPVVRRLPVDSLPAGSYRIELEAGDTAGKLARSYADLDIE